MCFSVSVHRDGEWTGENKATINKMETAWYSINVINNPIRFY